MISKYAALSGLLPVTIRHALTVASRSGTLGAADAAELAEMLQFLSDWLASDPGRLGASLESFIGNSAYGTGQLRQDLNRFVFLLGGSDGEPVFGP